MLREQRAGSGMANRLGAFFALAIGMVMSSAAAQQTIVRPGIEVLIAEKQQLLHDKRVGILTNQSGVDRAGASDVDRLRAAGVRLTAIFSPEHGFRGRLDREEIGDSVDPATGLPIFSLYGTTHEPTGKMLHTLDVLLIDLQDIGARPYTYISTTLLTLRAAAAAKKPVIVLDRPNPIGGELMQGPVLDRAFSSFVGMLPIPLRHGLTLGEMALLGNDTLAIHADLSVVAAPGWRRGMWFDATELPWVAPSPNMPSLESATHYPGLVLFEGTNVSVGRGTSITFQAVGAPWLKPVQLIARLGAVPGVVLSAAMLAPKAPSDGKYDGQEIPAVRLQVTDRAVYDPVQLAVALLCAMKTDYGDALTFDATAFDERAGSDRLRRAIERSEKAEWIWQTWADGLGRFEKERRRYLLY
jgi:uncharacterized protein YbbC (DUF1343 family)